MKRYVCGVCGYVYDPAPVTRTAALNPEPNLKTFRTTGFARSAGQPKISLRPE